MIFAADNSLEYKLFSSVGLDDEEAENQAEAFEEEGWSNAAEVGSCVVVTRPVAS